MANKKSSKKSVIKSKVQRKYNMSNKSMLRTYIKKLKNSVKNPQQSKSKIMADFICMQKCIDRQVSKGMVHKNRAARCKSKFFKIIKSLSV